MVLDVIYDHCQKVMMAKKMKSLQLIVVCCNQIRAVIGIFTSAAQIIKKIYCWMKLNDNVQLNPIQWTIFCKYDLLCIQGKHIFRKNSTSLSRQIQVIRGTYVEYCDNTSLAFVGYFPFLQLSSTLAKTSGRLACQIPWGWDKQHQIQNSTSSKTTQTILHFGNLILSLTVNNLIIVFFCSKENISCTRSLLM